MTVKQATMGMCEEWIIQRIQEIVPKLFVKAFSSDLTVHIFCSGH